jgi:serine/threonine protein kinase
MIRVVPASRKRYSPPDIASGRYLLVEEIGRGKTASVHRAWDRERNSQVAVKLPIVPKCPLAKEIFENEENALRQVSHPNVVSILDSGESEAGRFIVMELIRGACLRDIIAAGKMSMRKRIGVLGGICSALAELHRSGIVHRDVKPKNVMVAEDGEAKLLDFGYANIREGFCCQYLSRDRFGSPFYSAPELRKDSGDPRLDIYSLGMMTYEMLLLCPAVRLRSAIRMIEAQHSLAHLKRQVARGRIPNLAGELIEAAIRRDPEARASSIDDFGAMLSRLTDEMEGE